jgi:spore coat polysaccharide biosynthesis predicted glycosyltransferase SpsG
MKHKLCAGIPELSVPPIEPIVIDKIVILDSPNSKLRLSNLIINGLCDYNVTSFHMDLEHNRYDLDLSFKHLLINATYDFDVRLLVPIAQKGNVFITTGMWDPVDFVWKN